MKLQKIVFFIPLIFLLMISGNLSAQKKNAIPPAVNPEKGNSCIDCHSKLTGNLRQPVLDWKKSVHAAVGNRCNICHGGNPDMKDKNQAKSVKYHFIGKPNKKTVTEFCGRGGCHAVDLEQFKQGPHYQAVLKTGVPNCTTCHGIHEIHKTSIKVISETSCSKCHPVAYSREIIKMITDIDASISVIKKRTEFLRSKHAEVTDIENRLSDTRHLFHQLVHVFSREDMKSTKRIIQLEVRNLDENTESKVTQIKRLNMLYIIMVFFGLIIIIAILFYTIIMYTKRRL